MALEIQDLVAEVRAGTGKGAARAARRENKVPGIVYGAGQEPVSINMGFHYLLKRLKQGRFLAQIFNLKIEGGEEVKVVCRNVQRDVVKDMPTHIDFLRVADDTRVKLFVALDFINADKAPGIKRGGRLAVTAEDVLVEVVASAVPEAIVVDLEGKAIGDVITTADLVLPAGVKIIADRAFAVANIAAPTGLAAAAEE